MNTQKKWTVRAEDCEICWGNCAYLPAQNGLLKNT